MRSYEVKNKLKTHKGAAKRIKKTANGFKHRKANACHKFIKKSSNLKRELRGVVQVAACDIPAVKQMLPHA